MIFNMQRTLECRPYPLLSSLRFVKRKCAERRNRKRLAVRLPTCICEEGPQLTKSHVNRLNVPVWRNRPDNPKTAPRSHSIPKLGREVNGLVSRLGGEEGGVDGATGWTYGLRQEGSDDSLGVEIVSPHPHAGPFYKAERILIQSQRQLGCNQRLARLMKLVSEYSLGSPLQGGTVGRGGGPR